MIEDISFMGNSNGNLANGGYVSDFGDGVLVSMKDGIYILSKYTKEWEQIYDKEVKFLNISEDYIYFVDDRNTICEMGILDSSIVKLVERNNNNYDEIYYLSLIDENIYFAVFWGESVYRLNVIDGAEEFLFHAVGLNFALDEKYLYYSDDRDGKIRRLPLDEVDSIMQMDPTEKTNLWLEYQGFTPEFGVDILKKGLDRKIQVNEIVLEDVFGDEKSAFYMNFDEESLYYAGKFDEDDSDWKDEHISIYKIDMEDYSEEIVTEDNIDYLNISENWIVYRNNSVEGCLYCVSKDGLKKKKLTEFPVSNIHVIDEVVYCRNDEEDEAFYSIDLATHEVRNIREYYGIDEE